MTEALEKIREQLVELLPRLRRFARTLTRNLADADDLVQIALERALTRYRQWDPNSRLDSWMFGIIRNAWIDEVRSRKRRGQHIDVDEIGESVAGTERAETDMTAVQEALLTLPEEQRSA